jgi:hypothetical protein
MGNLEILYSGEREGRFLLYCISQMENGQYIVFTLEPYSLMEPFLAPDRETALGKGSQEKYEGPHTGVPEGPGLA